MSIVTTRTGNVVTLRQQLPELKAELQPLQQRGWSEGRNFRQTAAANAPIYRHPVGLQIAIAAVLLASSGVLGYLLWKAIS